MKKLLLLIVALLPTLVFAQNTQRFVVNSQVGKLNIPAKAYLIYSFGATQMVDSAAVVDGKFSITGTILDPAPAFLIIAHNGEHISTIDPQKADVLNLFLDKDTTTVRGLTDSVHHAAIIGSQINADSKSLTTQLELINKEALAVTAEYDKAVSEKRATEELKRAIQEKYKPIRAKQEALLSNYIKTHPDSYFSLFVLRMLAQRGDPHQVAALLNSLSPAIQAKELGKEIKTATENALATAIGSTAPDFTQNDINGKAIKLSSFRGKYVLLDFWASWCGPCRAESPNLVRAYNKYKSKNFTILSVSLDKPTDKEKWAAAIYADKLFWTHVSDLKFWDNQAARLYKVSSIPASFLLDPDGKIIARDLRGTDLDAKLTEVLSPTQTQPSPKGRTN